MKFSDFISTLQKYICTSSSKLAFTKAVIINAVGFDNIYDLFASAGKPDIEEKTIGNYYRARPFPKWLSSAILENLSKSKFENFINENLSLGDTTDELADALKKFGTKIFISTDNMGETCSNLFVAIMNENSSDNKNELDQLLDITNKDEYLQKELEQVVKSILLWEKNDNLSMADKIELDKNTELNYDPVIIEKKLYDVKSLKTVVLANVTEYYKMIKSFFLAEQKKSSEQAEYVSKTVKNKYLKVKTAVKGDKHEIFKRMRTFIQDKTENYDNDEILNIIVSYFIQSCEVFDASSK